PGKGGRATMQTDWSVGDRIQGRWQVEQTLRGGMGIVYVVLDHETQERLAAKTYREDVLRRNPDAPARFEREALAWIQLDAHPHIVRATSFQVVQHKPLLFLEFVPEGNLRQVLPELHEAAVATEQENCYIDPYLIQSLALQFCDGMIHATNHG